MIQLPYTPTNVLHRHGGRILELTSIKHQADKPSGGYSRDSWYFMGRVQWDDGSGDVSKQRPIDMQRLCSDNAAGGDEIRGLSDLMMEYLREHGEWSEGKPHEGWYAHRVTARDKRAQAGLSVARSAVRGVLDATQ